MRKRFAAALLCVVFIFTCSISSRAADGNMDAGGGGMGSGGTGSSWSDGHEGVRVSVVEKGTIKQVGKIIDWIGFTPPNDVTSFAKRTKLQYISGSSIAPIFNKYVFLSPDTPLPSIISPDGSSNIDVVKAYFCDETVVKKIARDVSISYETLISGKFTIVIEPLAVFQYNGTWYAMTATEAALYDRMLSGDLRAKMGYLTHQNLPLSMFLETPELGISAGGGSGLQPDERIISTLGIGTVNFGDMVSVGGLGGLGDLPDVYDYEYRAGTDVITSIIVTASDEINPDEPGAATFKLPGGDVAKEYVIPAEESQLVWVKWRTPDVDEAEYIDIPVNVSHGDGSGTVRVKITPIEENTPPDPQGRDRNDSWRLPPLPAEIRTPELNWGEWWAQWIPNWVWISVWEWHENMVEYTSSYEVRDMAGNISTEYDTSTVDEGWWEDNGYWEDQGWWDFSWSEYYAKLAVEANTLPDERVPTEIELRYNQGYEIKSGYGVNAEVEVRMTSDGGDGNISAVQNVIAVFPEFDYKTYNRFLVPKSRSRGGYLDTWGFKKNEYSQFTNPVHFTPIWYPDATAYPVSFTVLDAWTPAGQLTYVINSDDIQIDGNVYDDWHVAPGFSRG